MTSFRFAGSIMMTQYTRCCQKSSKRVNSMKRHQTEQEWNTLHVYSAQMSRFTGHKVIDTQKNMHLSRWFWYNIFLSPRWHPTHATPPSPTFHTPKPPPPHSWRVRRRYHGLTFMKSYTDLISHKLEVVIEGSIQSILTYKIPIEVLTFDCWRILIRALTMA